MDGVNKKRTLGDGTVLPWGSIVVLKMPKDQNDFVFPNLSCMVIGINHYKNQTQFVTDSVCRMQFCKGLLVQTKYDPSPQFDAQSVGINYESIKNIIMSKIQAGEAYSASGRKLSHCQCMKVCLMYKTCKCRKLKKFRGAKWHGGTGNNRFCRNCLPE